MEREFDVTVLMFRVTSSGEGRLRMRLRSAGVRVSGKRRALYGKKPVRSRKRVSHVVRGVLARILALSVVTKACGLKGGDMVKDWDKEGE